MADDGIDIIDAATIQPHARVIADSITPGGDRLTTMVVTMHRFVLAEFNTHRVFSRSSASSRAIPVRKRMDMVKRYPAYPLEWNGERPGMQGSAALEGEALTRARDLFSDVHEFTLRAVRNYLAGCEVNDLTPVHKSALNRLFEPFLWHTAIVASTEWENFFRQRVSPLAQPEIHEVAQRMQNVYDRSVPTPAPYVDPDVPPIIDYWHTPFIRADELEAFSLEQRLRISVARCARVSYLNHEGEYDLDADENLFRKLATAEPRHSAPMEMVARPMLAGYGIRSTVGNFEGWEQLRHMPGLIDHLLETQ